MAGRNPSYRTTFSAGLGTMPPPDTIYTLGLFINDVEYETHTGTSLWEMVSRAIPHLCKGGGRGIALVTESSRVVDSGLEW